MGLAGARRPSWLAERREGCRIHGWCTSLSAPQPGRSPPETSLHNPVLRGRASSWGFPSGNSTALGSCGPTWLRLTPSSCPGSDSEDQEGSSAQKSVVWCPHPPRPLTCQACQSQSWGFGSDDAVLKSASLPGLKEDILRRARTLSSLTPRQGVRNSDVMTTAAAFLTTVCNRPTDESGTQPRDRK